MKALQRTSRSMLPHVFSGFVTALSATDVFAKLDLISMAALYFDEAHRETWARYKAKQITFEALLELVFQSSYSLANNGKTKLKFTRLPLG